MGLVIFILFDYSKFNKFQNFAANLTIATKNKVLKIITMNNFYLCQLH